MGRPVKRKGRSPNRTATRKPPGSRPPAAAPKHPATGRTRRYEGLQINENIVSSVLTGTPPELLPIMTPAYLWLYHMEGAIGNRCVDAAFTLRYAYGELGIPVEILPVDLVVQNAATGAMIMHGQPNPCWENGEFTGHCILRLPHSGRFVDVTVEQYRQVARLQMGPLIGRLAPAGYQLGSDEPTPPGAHFAIQRKNLMLVYTVSQDDDYSIVASHPPVRDAQPAYRRAGINLASHTLIAMGIAPEVLDKARQSPYPRLRALLEAITDVQDQVEDGGDWYFHVPEPGGQTRRLRLDEIPLPPGTPAAA